MSKVTVTIEGDLKLAGYIMAGIQNFSDPEKSPIILERPKIE